MDHSQNAKRKQGTSIANDIDEFQDEWDALDEREGTLAKDPSRKKWVPEGMEPVLEEPGKWGVLAEVLMEIEREIISRPLILRASSPCLFVTPHELY